MLHRVRLAQTTIAYGNGGEISTATTLGHRADIVERTPDRRTDG